MATNITDVEVDTGTEADDLAVLVLAPTGRDSEAASTLLSRAGIAFRISSSLEHLCDQLDDGAIGAVMIAEEALTDADLRRLTGLLDRQPPWSDLPFVILTRAALSVRNDAHESRVIDELGNVMFLERPLNARTLVSAVRAALRARGRQYQVREHLLELERAEAAQREAKQALARQSEALAEADRRKDEFLATLAHELRNPLAPIRNSLQIMRLAKGNTEVAGDARETIARQLAQLVRLVDDLLDVSRITRNRIELRKERTTLSAMVRNAVETARPRIEARDQELIVDLSPDAVWLNADLARMAQVVSNLLHNAAKYTPDGGRISLRADREGDEAVIRVKDTGIGIPQPMLNRIFEMFAQVDESRHGSQGGLGIGLTLVKSIVEFHGGSVSAASAGPGHGSEFTVRLPVAWQEPAEESSGKPAEPEKNRPRRRILVVDDNRDSAESLALLLRMRDHEVRTAHDGKSALHEIDDFIPDLALLDIGMPEMNGYELVARMRQQPELHATALVAVTGWGQREDRRRSREAGFDHHLVKPVDLAAIEKLLAGIASRTAPG